jgi:hypothetical protein
VELRISEGEALPAEAWDFARDWTFSTPGAPGPAEGEEAQEGLEGIHPLLNVLHNILLLVLMFTSANYLLGCLFDDRKDKSILFWRSMPVAEWQNVFGKLLVVALVAPGIVIAVSLLLQVAAVGISAILVARMDMDPVSVVFGNLAPGRLLVDQVGGWILTALWLAPVWAWLLLASAAARRSPFLLAVAPVLAAMIAETLLFGSHHVSGVIVDHLPKLVDQSDAGTTSVGFYLFGPDWSGVDVASLCGGLAATALLLLATVYLRRHRWEL